MMASLEDICRHGALRYSHRDCLLYDSSCNRPENDIQSLFVPLIGVFRMGLAFREAGPVVSVLLPGRRSAVVTTKYSDGKLLLDALGRLCTTPSQGCRNMQSTIKEGNGSGGQRLDQGIQ